MPRSEKNWTRALGNGKATLRRPGLDSELCFAATRLAEGHPVIRAPRLFRFKRAVYIPDFYDAETGIYYEVVGTRQRAAMLAEKFDLMEVFYPDVRLEAMCPDGRPYRLRQGNRFDEWTHPLAPALRAAMAQRGLVLNEVADEIGEKQGGPLSSVMRRKEKRPGLLRRLHAWVVKNVPAGTMVPPWQSPSPPCHNGQKHNGRKRSAA